MEELHLSPVGSGGKVTIQETRILYANFQITAMVTAMRDAVDNGVVFDVTGYSTAEVTMTMARHDSGRKWDTVYLDDVEQEMSTETKMSTVVTKTYNLSGVSKLAIKGFTMQGANSNYWATNAYKIVLS